MQPAVFTKTLAAASATNIALVQAVGGAGNLTLNGAAVTGGVATLDTARRVGITSSGNDSGISFTVTGGDYAGTAITEVVTGSNGGVASTKQDFLTVSRVAASAAAAANVSVGTTSVGSTPWWVPNNHLVPVEIGLGLELLSGAATASIEVTDDSPLAQAMIYTAGWAQTPPVPQPFGWPALSAVVLALNAPQSSVVDRPIAALRLTINAGTGKVQATLRQGGIVVG